MDYVIALGIVIIGSIITSVIQHNAVHAFVKQYDLFNEHKKFCSEHKFYSLFI